jgi:hypothetical protein
VPGNKFLLLLFKKIHTSVLVCSALYQRIIKRFDFNYFISLLCTI